MCLFMIQAIDKKSPRFKKRGKAYQRWQKDIEQIANAYIELFVNLCVLQERIEGRLSAYEGIRVVKEAKMENV